MGTWLLLEQDMRHVGGGANQAEALGVEEELGEVGQGRGVSGARHSPHTPTARDGQTEGAGCSVLPPCKGRGGKPARLRV